MSQVDRLPRTPTGVTLPSSDSPHGDQVERRPAVMLRPNPIRTTGVKLGIRDHLPILESTGSIRQLHGSYKLECPGPIPALRRSSSSRRICSSRRRNTPLRWRSPKSVEPPSFGAGRI